MKQKNKTHFSADSEQKYELSPSRSHIFAPCPLCLVEFFFRQLLFSLPLAKTQYFIFPRANLFGQFSRTRPRCSSFACSPGVNMYFMSRRNAPAGITISLIKCSALSLRLITQADELIPDDSGSRLQGALSPPPHSPPSSP